METIGEYAFSGCNALEKIEIPDNVTFVGSNAFRHCEALTSVVMSDSVTAIHSSTFAYCYSLKEIEIPDSVTEIGEYVFWECESLESIEFPDSVTTVGNSAFYGCHSLVDVYYSGAEGQWYEIEFGTVNDRLLDANIHFNCVMPETEKENDSELNDKHDETNSDFKATSDKVDFPYILITLLAIAVILCVGIVAIVICVLLIIKKGKTNQNS